jgi:hypothetical protein
MQLSSLSSESCMPGACRFALMIAPLSLNKHGLTTQFATCYLRALPQSHSIRYVIYFYEGSTYVLRFCWSDNMCQILPGQFLERAQHASLVSKVKILR